MPNYIYFNTFEELTDTQPIINVSSKKYVKPERRRTSSYLTILVVWLRQYGYELLNMRWLVTFHTVTRIGI